MPDPECCAQEPGEDAAAASGLRRLARVVTYEGSAYQGWQSQTHGLTVQDKLQAALGAFCAGPVTTICAGRTDTGVHARRQVVHLDTLLARSDHAWVHGVNRYLPLDISIASIRTVDEGFHARFSATARHYEYWIWNHPVRHALLARRCTWVFRPLDADRMQEAGRLLLGTQDFSAFRAAECQARSPVKTLFRCEIQRIGPWLIRCRFSADAFLHHMVRNLMGSLVEIGCGRRSLDWLVNVLGTRNRSLAAPTLAPDGLYLAGIDYDSRWQIDSSGFDPAPPWGIGWDGAVT